MTPYDEPADSADADGEEPENTGEHDGYQLAGRSIRHAIADGDDAALAEAICHLIDIHSSRGSEPKGGEKPNLAILLAAKRKK